MKIGINGFGRIGRLVFRALWGRPGIELVHVNDPAGDAATAAHLLEFDSVHGRYPGVVSSNSDSLNIDDKRVTFSDERYPGAIEWDRYGVDIVIEASGKFKDTDSLKPYLDNGASSVVVAAPVKSPGVLNVVMGCNDDL